MQALLLVLHVNNKLPVNTYLSIYKNMIFTHINTGIISKPHQRKEQDRRKTHDKTYF